MASSKDLQPSSQDKLAQRRAAEQDVLLREVDEAVRQDEFRTFVQRYGVLVGALFVLAMAALAGGLWWKGHREGQHEARSETLITAFDALGSGNVNSARQQLAPLVQDGPAASAAARLSLAAIAARQNQQAEAVKQYEAVASDGDAPQPYRDIATIRIVATQFDQMKPEQVIARMRPLATPGSAWFGSAGELLAMAYLKQGRNDLAGPLLASIAKDENVPGSIRARTRQLSGLLGYDAVVDVRKTLNQLRDEQGGTSPAAPAPAANAPPAPAASGTPATPAPR